MDKIGEACGYLLMREFSTFVYCCGECQNEFDTGTDLESHILSEHAESKRNIEHIIVDDGIFVTEGVGAVATVAAEELRFSSGPTCLKSEIEIHDEIPSNGIYGNSVQNDEKTVENNVILENDSLSCDDDFGYGNDISSDSDDLLEPMTSISVPKKTNKRRTRGKGQAIVDNNLKIEEKPIKIAKKSTITKSGHKENISSSKNLKTNSKKAKKSQSQRKLPTPVLFYCEMCPGRTFTCKGNLCQHMKIHTTIQQFCTICNSKPRNYEKHMMTKHTYDRPYKCDICDASFKKNINRVIHMRTHTGERPFLCVICGTSYRSQAARWKHEMRSHQKRKLNTCQECNRTFYSPYQLREHINAIHLKVRLNFCNICGKDFATKRYLYVHKRTHAEAKLQCKYCDKVFKLWENRRKHERTVHETIK